MQKTELKIKIYGNPVLRKKAKPVAIVAEKEQMLFDWMLQIMYESGGIGLAAPQIGLDIQMIVADVGQGPTTIANPKIIYRQGKQIFEEGCLSVPGICVSIERSKNIKLEGLDRNGHPIKIEAKDLMATCLQHEIDHLHGKLIVDYLSFRKKFKLMAKLKELRKRSRDESMPKPEEKSCRMQL